MHQSNHHIECYFGSSYKSIDLGERNHTKKSQNQNKNNLKFGMFPTLIKMRRNHPIPRLEDPDSLRSLVALQIFLRG